MNSDIATRIRQHVISTFLFDEADQMIPDEASLLEAGLVDSTGVLDLICFIEEEFGLRVADEDVTPANFDSVDRMTTYVASRQARRSPARLDERGLIAA
jgi:acyl carrier protein